MMRSQWELMLKKQVPIQYDFFVRNHTYGLKIF